jgi:protein-L-isoaspartate(D-aspartate) O-methyltransferase
MGQDLSKEREMMVQGLVQEGLLKSPSVISAIGTVPRELFVPEHLRRYAYNDTPLPTERGQTISAPHGMICRALHGRHDE